MVFLPGRENEPLSNFQKAYDKRKTYWIMFWPFLSNSLEFRSKMYNSKAKHWAAEKLFAILDSLIKNGRLKFRADDMKKIENLRKHGKAVKHTVLYKKEFEILVSKYFQIVSSDHPKRWLYSEMLPIYSLRKK